MSKPWVTMVAKLKADSAVAALIGARVYPMLRPQGTTLPAIEYEVTNDNPLNVASGATTTSECTITVDCIASTYIGARALAAAVQTCLGGTADANGDIWHLTNQADVPGDIAPGQDIFESYVVSQDYSVWHS